MPMPKRPPFPSSITGSTGLAIFPHLRLSSFRRDIRMGKRRCAASGIWNIDFEGGPMIVTPSVGLSERPLTA